jgi:IclR family transcriptional regulator, KDG regulon repressor
MTPKRASSLRRGTEILIALGSDEALERDGLGVVRIAEIVGTEKSQVSRALSAFTAGGLVDRDPESGVYRLGWRLFTLATRSGRPRLIARAPRHLQGLAGITGETANLSVLEGGQTLTLLSEAPPSDISAKGWSGRTLPVVCTSAGRALLFDHDRADLATLLVHVNFAAYGPKAPGDLDELHRRLDAARDRGYATVDGEFEPDLVGVAAPVRDPSGRILAAVNVSGPTFRLGRRLAPTGDAVRAAAAALSESIFSPPEADPDATRGELTPDASADAA